MDVTCQYAYYNTSDISGKRFQDDFNSFSLGDRTRISYFFPYGYLNSTYLSKTEQLDHFPVNTFYEFYRLTML